MRQRKLRLLNGGLLISFLFCYLEWAGGNSTFIYKAEWDIFTNLNNLQQNFSHPIILICLFGQVAILYSVLATNPIKWINVTGVILLMVFVFFLWLIGWMALNKKMILLNFPFLAFAFFFLKLNRRK